MKPRMAARSILQKGWESKVHLHGQRKGEQKRIMEVGGTDLRKLGAAADLANMETPKLPSGVEIHCLRLQHDI